MAARFSYFIVTIITSSSLVHGLPEDVPANDISMLAAYGAVKPVDHLTPWSERKKVNAVPKRSLRDDLTSSITLTASAEIDPTLTVTLPTLTIPSLPTIPTGLPSLPTLTIPSLPTIPTGLPSLPTLTIPSLPTIPTGLPSLPTFTIPSLPTLFPTNTQPVTAGVKCTNSIEIMLFQDISFGNEHLILELSADVLAQVELDLKNQFVDAKIGAVTFSDLEVAFVSSGDYCARYDTSLSSDFAGVIDLLAGLKTSRTPHLFANQLGALIAGVQSGRTTWSQDPKTIKLALMVTNTIPHFALDGLNLRKLPAFSPQLAVTDFADSCSKQYYPSPKQLADVLFDESVYLGFVLPSSLLQAYVQGNYKWLSAYLNQTASLVQVLNPVMSDLSAKIQAIVNEIASVECSPVSPTTIPPSTASTIAPPTSTIAPPTSTTTPHTTTIPPTTTTIAPTEVASTTSAPVTSTITPTTATITPISTTIITTQPTTTSIAPTCTSTENGSCATSEPVCAPDDVVIRIREAPKRLHLELDDE